ncbi:glycosyltransferase family 1 protein [Micrococcus sp.]|uniref:glycosyltransferase family 4 protein n=1 Tax=Micrococcus sp. TaxID=1271 RepID=UPI002A913A1B|nr:glycosyltransferase family 1 protein [Micrococcus sp.]MDY6056154.1 glycosyltransferase family 1 protein [Micrococcus sp.]
MIYLNARFLSQPVTGIQRFAENVAAELLSLRDDITLVAPTGVTPRDDGPLAGTSVLGVPGGAGLLWEQVTLPAFLRKQANPLLLGLASTNPRRYRPQVSTHHDVTYVRYPESFSRAFRAAYRTVIPGMLESSASVLTVSEFSRSDIADHYGIPEERIVVVGNAPTDLGGSALPRQEDAAPYFLAVSSPNVHKNFHRLVKAFDKFRKKSGSSTNLRVVGAQPKVFSSTESRIEDIDGVTFMGRVDDQELGRLYAGARAFIFPSLHEGFGIPPIEAQSLGVPVASSNTACMPEILGDSALYFDPRSISDMAEVLERLDRDPIARQKLSSAGRKNAERYTWRNTAETVSQVLDHALQEADTQ